jgi:hypothetical protein
VGDPPPHRAGKVTLLHPRVDAVAGLDSMHIDLGGSRAPHPVAIPMVTRRPADILFRPAPIPDCPNGFPQGSPRAGREPDPPLSAWKLYPTPTPIFQYENLSGGPGPYRVPYVTRARVLRVYCCSRVNKFIQGKHTSQYEIDFVGMCDV